MSTVPAKQIIKILAAPIRVNNFSANGSSNTVTSAITTALTTAGAGGVSVPLQVSASEGLGVIASGANNKVEIYSSTSKDKIGSVGEEVYGRLTEAGGVYTLSYYTLSNAGIETAYSFSSATNIDFEFNYRFDFARFPTDGAISITARNISNDPGSTGGMLQREQLTPTAQNTLPNLTKTPISASGVSLIINGIEYDSFGGGAAPFSVNISTKAVSWSAANAGFSIETTDRVIAQYTTLE